MVPPWEDFGDPPRDAVRVRLAADQAQLCCYCTATVAQGGDHIEHWKPRERYPALTYSWSNLIASCQSDRHGSVGDEIIETQLHCGEAKGNWFEGGVTIDPLHRDVEALFRYPFGGRIEASKQLSGTRFADVEMTITKLNLNAPSLVARRRTLLALAGMDAVLMTRDRWVHRYLAPQGGILQEFWPALSYNYHKHWFEKFERA